MNKYPIYGKGQEMNAQTYAQTPSYMTKANACGLENSTGGAGAVTPYRGAVPGSQADTSMPPTSMMPAASQMPAAPQMPATTQMPATAQMPATTQMMPSATAQPGAGMPAAGQGLFAPITPTTEPMPVTLESMQYINGYLRTQIGRKVTIQFLIGTNTMQDRTGTLLAVGANYVIIREVETDDLLVCDFFSIKFVRIYF